MRSRRHVELSEETGIDLAPMLDFVLNLLIFFIITTSFIKEAGVNVIRPEAETAEYKQTGNILIAIRPNSEVWMDRRKVAMNEIRTIVERMHAERPEDTVVILADKDAQTGLLTQVMDQVRSGGIETVSIAAHGAGG
jgi:biopolymer transport protein ExbD